MTITNEGGQQVRLAGRDAWQVEQRAAMTDLLTETQAELGLADATLLASLAPDSLVWLRDAARNARNRERAALQAAVDRAMEHVPRLLRGAVRRILFP